MPLGPGRYDDLCTYVREKTGIEEGQRGGVVLIVLGGDQGGGFSCQADAETTLALPELLEMVAKSIRGEFQS